MFGHITTLCMKGLIKIEYTVTLKTFRQQPSQFNNFTCLQFLFTSRTFYCYNFLLH